MESGDLANHSRYNTISMDSNSLKKYVGFVKHGHLNLYWDVHLDHHLHSPACELRITTNSDIWLYTIDVTCGHSICIDQAFGKNKCCLLSPKFLNDTIRLNPACYKVVLVISNMYGIGNSGFPYMLGSHEAGVSDLEVITNVTSNTSLRAGQTA